MLSEFPKNGSFELAQPISNADEKILRSAYRSGDYIGNCKVESIILSFCSRNIWLACDCRAGEPPILAPVAGKFHLRRLTHRPEHVQSCDFYTDPKSHSRSTDSYLAPVESDCLNLLLPQRDDVVGKEHSDRPFRYKHKERSSLAKLLMQLLHGASLNQVNTTSAERNFFTQMNDIRKYSQRLSLTDGPNRVFLSEFLITDRNNMGMLCVKLQEQRKRFGKCAPHGVLICVVDGRKGDALLCYKRPRLDCASASISIFAEPSTVRDKERVGNRGPYLAICLIGEKGKDGAMGVIRAYLHPCLAAGKLFPVDSTFERDTTWLLRSTISELSYHLHTNIVIEKPVFDVIGPQKLLKSAVMRPVCIPDFVIRVAEKEELGIVAREAIIETMGYTDIVYRERKKRIHPQMSAALGGAEVFEFDPTRGTHEKVRLKDQLVSYFLQDFTIECQLRRIKQE